MNFHTRRFAVFLCPIVLLAACATSGQQRTARLLDQRLQTSLAPDIAAGRAAVQQLPDGARVTLLDNTLFSNSADALDNRENDVRASLMEALLDPSLMRLQVADTSLLPDEQRQARVRNMVQYFQASSLALSLLPSDPLQPAADPAPTGAPAPKGMTVTINVDCSQTRDGSGYGSGQARPACD